MKNKTFTQKEIEAFKKEFGTFESLEKGNIMKRMEQFFKDSNHRLIEEIEREVIGEIVFEETTTDMKQNDLRRKQIKKLAEYK